MVAGIAANVVNAALGWSLIYGHAGLPALGVRGGAIASVTAEVLEAAALAALLVRDTRRSGDYARARAELPIAKAARELAAVGVPTGLQFGSEMLAMVTFTSVLGTLGAEQIAAHQIALAIIRLSFLPGGVAISEAVSVLVGQALGRRSVADADRVVAAALAVAVAFMATCGVLFAFAGQTIVAAFTEVAPVARVARTLLWIAAGFQVPAMIGVAVIWTCVPTAAVVLGRGLGWGAAGGWCGFVAETTIGAYLFAQRWRRGAWRGRYAPREEGPLTPDLAA
jgi:MATE family multidrug resistance protein